MTYALKFYSKPNSCKVMGIIFINNAQLIENLRLMASYQLFVP